MSMTAEETGTKEPKAKVEGSDSWEVVPKGAFQLVRIKIGGYKGKIGYYGADLPVERRSGQSGDSEFHSSLAMVRLCFEDDGIKRIPRSNLEAYGPILPVHRLLTSLLEVWDADEANALGDWCLERGLEVLGEQLVECATTVVNDPRLVTHGKCGPTVVAYDCLRRLSFAMGIDDPNSDGEFVAWGQRWFDKHIKKTDEGKEVYGDTDSVIRANGLGGVTCQWRVSQKGPA